MCKPCCSCAAVRALLKENHLAPVLWQFRKTISFISFQSLRAAVIFAVSGVLASPQQQPGCPPLSLELVWGSHGPGGLSELGHDPAHHCSANPGEMAKGEGPSQDNRVHFSQFNNTTHSCNSVHDSGGTLFPLSDSLKAACHIISCMLITLKLFQLRCFFKILCPNTDF